MGLFHMPVLKVTCLLLEIIMLIILA